MTSLAKHDNGEGGAANTSPPVLTGPTRRIGDTTPMTDKNSDAAQAAPDTANPEEQAFKDSAELHRLYLIAKQSLADRPDQPYADQIKKSLWHHENALKIGRGTLH